MRTSIKYLLIFMALTGLWLGLWSWLMAADVARVKASIAYQNQQFKSVTPHIVLKADAVSAYGFPFRFQVKVVRPTLSMIFNRETYAVSLPEVVLTPTDAAQGRYRVALPATFDALYARDGAAPENYRVTMDAVPELSLRAAGDSRACDGLPGSVPCKSVAADAPLVAYAVGLPPAITLHMELNGESRDARFDLPALLRVPVFTTIPKHMDYPLEIFVGVLREALVYKTGQ